MSSIIWFVILLLSVLAALGIGAMVTFLARNSFLGKRLKESEDEAAKVLEEAERQKANLLLASKEEALQLRISAENELKERRSEVQQQEKRMANREENLERRFGTLEQREQSVADRDRELETAQAAVEQLKEQQEVQLQTIAGLTVADAQEQIFKKAEDEARHDLTRKYWELEQQYKDESDDTARMLVTMSIERLAADVVAESTVTSVPLPNDEMKGRLIGREGRNIRALEQATGVDLIVDDTPGAVTLSCFDPIRREIARIALTKLIVDGRIHPARVEEMVEKARQEMDKILKEAGEQAVFEAGVRGLHADLIKQLGRLKFRTSYGSNVLKESVLAARVAAMLAAEIGANVEVCKTGALLHDIGKTLTHEVEGPHAELGGEVAAKYGVPEAISRAIAEHHDHEKSTVEAFIVSAADAITSSRPGARSDTVESYIKRLQDLEEVAKGFEGVEKVFAIQAGREIRVMVKPEQIDDATAAVLSRDIAKKVQETLVYPGQIKVMVVRETRNVEYAK